MSTAPSQPPTAAPWRPLFLSHMSQMPQATFTLSTLHTPRPGPSTSAAATPRARTCVYRSLWAALPDNPRNPAPRNPPVFASDLPVFTTDARMAKLAELGGGGREGGGEGEGGGDGGEGEGTQGGGAVEAVWWVPAVQTQWRVRGAAWVLGPEPGAAAWAALRARMRGVAAGGGPEGLAGEREGEKEREKWSWETEVTAHFGNLSPAMRGTFRNPPPGTPRAVPGGEGEGLGQVVEDLEDGLARANFRVCVIVPDEVDLVDLSRPDDHRRWLYTYIGDRGQAAQPGAEVRGQWEVCEVWP